MDTEVAIIGAGITGLSAGMELQDRAVIFESRKEIGGTVRSFCVDDGYWFDNVVHLLHFRNADVEHRIKSLMNGILKPCPPVGWVNTKAGTVRYPFQLNLGGLNTEAQSRCWDDFVSLDIKKQPASYKNFLENTFGKAMCDIFFFPYNEKQWKYPLDEMTACGQVWNINIPFSDQLWEGIQHPNQPNETYNSNAYYPRPPKDSPLRGMGLLTKKLAERVKNLNLNCTVQKLDTLSKQIITSTDTWNFNHCLSTIPLPALMNLCNTPASLLKEVNNLKWNKVISIGLTVKGRRPEGTGHWHYYADPEVPFTKVIYMTEFDENNAPEDGYNLLLEIPESHDVSMFANDLVHTVPEALYRLKILNTEDRVLGMYFWEVDPAYVIFTKGTPQIVEHCKEYLAEFNITPLGRYGSWEYSSMAENIGDGFNYARQIE